MCVKLKGCVFVSRGVLKVCIGGLRSWVYVVFKGVWDLVRIKQSFDLSFVPQYFVR